MIKIFQLIFFVLICSVFSQGLNWAEDQIPESSLEDNSQIKKGVSIEEEIEGYMDQPWEDWSEEKQRGFVKRLNLFYKKNPQSKLIPIISKTIGDVFYRQKKNRKMIKWYRRAARLNPDIAKKTTVGYRIMKAEEDIFWENIKILIYSLQFILIFSILFTIIKKRVDLNMTLLRKKFLIITPGYIVLSLAVLVVDFIFSKRALHEYLSFTKKGVTVPVVLLNVLDSTSIGFLLLFLSFSTLPILLAILLSSYKNRSRTFVFSALLQIVVMTTTIWAHFLINNLVTTEHRAMYYNHHMILPGEVEELFLEYPKKVIKSNPEFLNSENIDLKIFVEKHFPNGIESK